MPPNVSAPGSSRTTLESISLGTRKHICTGKFTLASPVITLTDALCVAAMIRNPSDRPFCSNIFRFSSNDFSRPTVRSSILGSRNPKAFFRWPTSTISFMSSSVPDREDATASANSSNTTSVFHDALDLALSCISCTSSFILASISSISL